MAALQARWDGEDPTGPLPGRWRLTCERCARGGVRSLDEQWSFTGLGARVHERWLRAEVTDEAGVRVVRV
jgi:hypothetical protein